VQAHDNRSGARHPHGFIQVANQKRAAAVDEQVNAVVGQRDTSEHAILIVDPGQIDLEELDIRYVLLCGEFPGQFQVAGLTLDADDGAAFSRQDEGQFAMSAAEIKHIRVRAEMLIHQFNKCVFAIASRDGGLPAMGISPRSDPWILQPAIHVVRSRISCHELLHIVLVAETGEYEQSKRLH
jgi:hypothetical protein